MFIAPTQAERLLARIQDIPAIVTDQRFIATGALVPEIENTLAKEAPKAEKPIYRAASSVELHGCNENKKPYINYWI